jgi:hypothetical protein
MNITINIQAPELANAIIALAASLGQKPVLQANPSMVNDMQTMVAEANQVPVTNFPTVAPFQNNVPVAPPVQNVPVNAPVQNIVPVAQPGPLQIQQQHQQPVQQPQPQGVPTTATTYTMDQLAVAATQLVDAGRREELLQLLASFGAPALMQLPQEMYGSFATKLREMGARI